MPRYYIKKSGNIQAGDQIWDHGPGTNGNNNATRMIDPDTGRPSTIMIGTALAMLSGDRIIINGAVLVVDATSKGFHAPGTVVGTVNPLLLAPPSQAGVAGPAQRPQGGPPPQPVPVPIADPGPATDPNSPKDDLIGQALTRDPDTGKPIKKPYVPESYKDFVRDDIFDLLRDHCG